MRTRNERFISHLLARQHVASPSVLAATRTKTAENPPPEFTWREYAGFLLSVAAQIEHSLMVQYLYAAWSLGGMQVPAEQRNSVAAWRQTILGIAKEEMGHLATVLNLLRFLDAPIELDREDYPWDSGLAPYPFALERLTRATLAKYILAESPEQWPADVTSAERAEIEKLAAGSGTKHINRVGILYAELIDLFKDAARLPNSAFHPETYPTQSSWDEYARGYGKGARGSSVAGTKKTPDVLVMRASSRAEAVAALAAVAEQGEAPDEAAMKDDEVSHFRRFLKVFREFPEAGAWEATIAVPSNPAAPGMPSGAEQTLIQDDQAGLWANIFNIRYRMLLSFLAHSHAPIGPDGLVQRQGIIVNRMFGEMYNLRAIASVLTRLPLKPNGADRAGAPFQMPYTLQLPDDDASFWRLHLDLLKACRALLLNPKIASGDAAEYAATLLSLDETAVEEMSLYASASKVRTGVLRPTGAIA
ncbi:ferritin-like domain-containing protein [Bradyrhizobium sp. CCBAU 21362]|uniref:ferritin-like domain-containing protein n=1 Tax=Bradyrhizobium sp. CCBAU 21362 TaxID=1325082 RepID=UPI0023059E7D|nr:ferritin-like domain-containing protein [Bradyrhizobium sp. CCBAU 21362]